MKRRKHKRLFKLLPIVVIAVVVIVFIKDFNENKREIEGKAQNFSQNSSYNQESDPLDYLEDLAKTDSEIKKIVENKDAYPEILLEMLARNLDMTEFVLNYTDLKGQVLSNDIGKVEKGRYPTLLQYDKRWGYGIYGKDVIAIEGCGPTALSVVIAGLTGKNDITPYDIAEYAKCNGYYDSGTSWSFFTKGVKHFGIAGREIPLSKNSILNELEQGHPIICSMRKGDFTTTGHIIAIVGEKNGKFVVRDPNSSERSKKLWDYDKIESQIKNLWSFKVK